MLISSNICGLRCKGGLEKTARWIGLYGYMHDHAQIDLFSRPYFLIVESAAKLS